MNPLNRLVLACAMWLWPAVLAAQEEQLDSRIDRLIDQLAVTEDSETRIQAAKALREFETRPQALSAVPALKLGMQDQSADVRSICVIALGHLLFEQDQRCPPELIDCLINDPSSGIRQNARLLADLFEEFSPGALEPLLEHYATVDPDEGYMLLMLLAKAGGRDPRVLKILNDAVTSTHGGLRGNGTAALWAATRDLDRVVPLYFERLADNRNPDQLTGKHAETLARIGMIGISNTLFKHLHEQESDFIAALNRIVESDDPARRRELARYLRLCLSVGPAAIDQSRESPADKVPYRDLNYAGLQTVLDQLAADEDPETRELAGNATRALQRIDEPGDPDR